jgi:hypothetical protein
MLYVDCLECKYNVGRKCTNQFSGQHGRSMDDVRCGPYKRCGCMIPNDFEKRKIQKKKDLIEAAELILAHAKSL